LRFWSADKRELDFVVLRNRKPEFAVECKSGERAVSPAAIYFKERTAIPAFYQTHLGSQDFIHAGTGIRVLPFCQLATELSFP
jgi:hypothetical protein